MQRGVGRMPLPRQERPFSEKLKAFFRVGRSQGFPRPGEDTLVLSSDTLSELAREQPVAGRLKVVRELQNQVCNCTYARNCTSTSTSTCTCTR